MNGKEFIKAVKNIVKEKNISEDIVFDAMSLALQTAYKKNFNSKTNVRVDIDRETGDIKVFSYFYDVIIISGGRLVDELETIKKNYPNSISIGVISNKENKLTESEKNHFTEVNLDNYSNYDYRIDNSGSYEELKEYPHVLSPQ